MVHHLANSRKDLIKWFMHGVRKYGRLESMAAEGDPRRWKAMYDSLLREHNEDSTPFVPSRRHPKLVEFLFPELLPLPQTVARSLWKTPGRQERWNEARKRSDGPAADDRAYTQLWGSCLPPQTPLGLAGSKTVPCRIGKHMTSKPARLWF